MSALNVLASPAAGGCSSDSPLASLACGTWARDALPLVWAWITEHVPQLAAATVLLIAARVGCSWWRQRVWTRHAARAVWLEIVPPVAATPAATVHLWRLLATLLPAPRRWTRRPARLVWEVQATPTGMRCGLWIPPGINPTAVVRVLNRAWPGARVDQTIPPRLAPHATAAALGLTLTRPEWLPLVDDATPPARRDGTRPEEDLTRAVYDGLASAGRTGGGLLQIVVGRAPRPRIAGLRRATVDPTKARQSAGGIRMVRLVADGLRAGIIAILNLVTPGPSGSGARTRQQTNPYDTELARQARAKYATAPHLLIAVTGTGLGPTTAAAFAAAADITSGFGLLSGHFSRRRLHRPVPTVTRRWVPAQRMLLATVAETAALAALPAEPAAYGLPAAAARQRPSSRDTHAGNPSPHDRRRDRPSRPAPPNRTAPTPTRPDPLRPNPLRPDPSQPAQSQPAQSDDMPWSP